MPKPQRTRSVPQTQVRAFLGKAEEYLAAARSELEAERSIAATSLAVHSAINAADAVTGVRMGRRSAGQDHDEALRLLREAGQDGKEVEKELARLLPLKTTTEYEPDEVPRSVAARAVERAFRCLTVARRLVSAM